MGLATSDIIRIVQETNGNYAAAARQVGVSRQYISKVMCRLKAQHGDLRNFGIIRRQEIVLHYLKFKTPVTKIAEFTGYSVSGVYRIKKEQEQCLV